MVLDTFIYIGAIILLAGWIGLFIVALSDKFDDDNQKKSNRKPLPKIHLYKTSKTKNPWLR